jgi:hypothetical protein
MTAMPGAPRRGNRTLSRALELLLALGLASACSTATRPPVSAPAQSPGWLSSARQHIAEREYRASADREGLQAPNRAHHLRIHFSSTGIAVHDRVAGTPLFSLAVSSIGRGTRLARVAPGTVVSEGTRIEIRRPGLIEWYENSPAGLEQGFTLAQRPIGEDALAIELALSGATATLRGGQPVFVTTQGRQLSYGKLAAFDARGRALPSRFELSSPSTVRLSVDDRAASYPVVIDPLLTGVHARFESDDEFGRLGFSVAGAGDVNGDGFDDVIVGAPYYDAGSVSGGAAFVFLGSASGMADGTPATAAAQLVSDQASANFGESVAGAGDVNDDDYADVIVGAPRYGTGAAFVFHGSATGIADANPADADPFTAATRLTVDPPGTPPCATGGNPGFGESVAGAGDVNGDELGDVIVGAPRYPSCSGVSGVLSVGAAFVFLGDAGGIADASALTAATRIEGQDQQGSLGASVAGAGDVNGDGFDDVIVGAPLHSAVESDEGAAFVFLGSELGVASGTPATAAAQLESNQSSANLGSSVASAGDVDADGYGDVIAGAPDYDDAGAAFIFRGGASGVASGNPTTAATRLASDQLHASLGISVAGVGDVDGDGYGDVLVGASRYDVAGVEAGAAFLFGGSAAGVADATEATAAARVEGSQNEERFGARLAGAGDVNGDGENDVIVGASGHDDGQFDEGAAFVYLPEPGFALALSIGAALLAALRRRA